MFKQLLEALKGIFGSLFGSSTPAPDTSKPPTTLPTPEPETPQDGADLARDTVVVVVREEDVKIVPPTQQQEEDEPESVVANEPNTPAEEPKPSVVVPKPKPEVTAAGRAPRYMWCLDNGHGKATPGKRSPVFEVNGVRQQFFEYEFNRAIVRRIINGLKERGIKYYNVVPEVEGDISLAERVNRANTLKSDLPKIYVSVHSNAGPEMDNGWSPASISGVETWYYHGSTKGQKIAAVFQKHIVEATGWKNRHIKSKPSGQFYVLRYTSMAAVLTENGFFTNEKEARELMKEEVRDAIAEAHIAAIMEIEEKGIV